MTPATRELLAQAREFVRATEFDGDPATRRLVQALADRLEAEVVSAERFAASISEACNSVGYYKP